MTQGSRLKTAEARVRWPGHWLHAEVNIVVHRELSVERGYEIAKKAHRRIAAHDHGEGPTHSH